ncbi:hypothetical protein L0337_22250 [candidate division KSB1 bacterium]|nr:hypothetical protein [candidate division KSB1 bacterium]
MLAHKNFTRVFWLTFLTTGMAFLPLFSDEAFAQENCQAQLAQAEKEYTNGRFDEAVTLLTPCVNKGKLSAADEQRAYKLLGLAYLGKDYVDQAKNAIRKLLELVPGYEPDPDQDPPPYTNMVREVKKELQAKQPEKKPETPTPVQKEPEIKQKKGGGTKWILIGGGVVVAGVGAALALGGGGGGGTQRPPLQQLPTPPSLP